jgi:hypothetical protein
MDRRSLASGLMKGPLGFSREPIQEARVLRTRISLLVATIAVFAVAAPAAAAAPVWEEVSVDETFFLPRTSEACGFDVFEHDEGQLKFQVIEYTDGSLRFKDLAVRVSQSLVAPSQGTTVELQPGGRGGHVFLVRPDGSALELSHGTNGHVTVPGEGVIYMWAGIARATFAPDGTVVENQHGFIMDTYSSLCPRLAG